MMQASALPIRAARQRRSAEARWESLAVIVYLLLVTGAFGLIDRLIYGSWDGKAGTKITQSINLIQMALSLTFFARALLRRPTIRASEAILLALALFLVSSAVWSFDPQTSFRRGTIYVFFVIAVIGIARLCDVDRLMRLMAAAFGLSALGSILLFAVSPSAALMMDSPAQEMQGIFTHKNVLGQAMAVGALACLHLMRTAPRLRSRAVLLLAGLIIVALASKSATACLTILLFCSMNVFVGWYRRGGATRAVAIALLVVGGPIMIFVMADPSTALELIGKDPTLTGRTELWAQVADDIAQRPVLGWGLGAFWIESNPTATEISNLLGWVVPHAHNGVLEMLLEVGVVGTGLFLFIWAKTIVSAVRLLGTVSAELGVTTLMACVGLVVIGATEIVLLDPTQALISAFFALGILCTSASRARPRRMVRQPRPVYDDNA